MRILAAFYGPREVTDLVRSKVVHNELTIEAENSLFGNTWPGHKKTLVVFYRYGRCSKVFQRAAAEGEIMSIKRRHIHHGHRIPPYSMGNRLVVLGAVYGKEDVTGTMGLMVAEGRRDIKASGRLLGGVWRRIGQKHTLAVIYRDKAGRVKAAVAKERDSVHLA